MATDLEKLVVQLSADIKGYENALNKAKAATNRQMRSIEKRHRQSVDVVAASMGKIGAALGGAAALKSAQQLIDTSTRIDNALKVAGVSGQQLTAVYDALYASAQRNAAPLESLVQLYGRASLVQKELGVSTQDLLKFTDNVAIALRVSGKSAQESSGALLQLSQALGSGVVRAEEFNSMLEGALPIVQAAARGIDEAGGSVAKLRQLVVDGKVSSAALFKGFQVGAETLKQQVAGATYTVAQGFERLRNASIDAAKKINDASGAGKSAADILDSLAFVVTKLADAFQYLAKSRGGTDRIDELGAAARNLWNDPSFQNLYEFLFDASKSKAKSAARDAIDARVRGLDDLRKAMAGVNAEATKTGDGKSNKFDDAFGAFGGKKVKLSDYPVKPTDKDGSAADLDTFQRRMAMTQRQIDLMGVEARTIDQTAAARERARVVVELETAAREANRKAGLASTEVTAAQRTQIEALADAYGKAAAQLEQLNGPLASYAREAANTDKQLQDLVVGGLNQFEDSLMDVISGTKSAEEAFKAMTASILNDIARMVIRMTVLGPLAKGIGGLFGFSEGGAVPGFATGGYTGGGGKYQPAGVVHKGEYVFDADATRRIGVKNLERLRQGFAEGGFVGSAPRLPNLRGGGGAPINAPVSVSIDARGADRDGLSRVEEQVARLKAELPSRIVSTVKEAKSRRAL
ncbi:MAG TPA: tape measure protein [Pseudolabrys sp.]|nr:tape measure protein [Pseudolabrys sp.]